MHSRKFRIERQVILAQNQTAIQRIHTNKADAFHFLILCDSHCVIRFIWKSANLIIKFDYVHANDSGAANSNDPRHDTLPEPLQDLLHVPPHDSRGMIHAA